MCIRDSIILIPEIPYSIDSVVAKIDHRANAGHGFTILAVAEGAMSKKEAAMSKKEYKKHLAELLDFSRRVEEKEAEA